MKPIKKTKYNAYIASMIFFAAIFCSAVIFVLVSSHISRGSGWGNGDGPYVFGLGGDGSGTGDGKGSGSASGNSDSKGKGDGKGDGQSENASKTGNNQNPGDGKSENKNKGSGNSEKTVKSTAKLNEKKDIKSASASTAIPGKFDLEGRPVAQIYLGEDDKTPPPPPPKAKKTAPKKVKVIKKPRKVATSKNSGEANGGGGSGERGSFTSGGRNVFRLKRNKDVLFIVDISPSMEMRTTEQLTRLQIMQQHLKQSLRNQQRAKSKGSFSIIAFSSETNYFPTSAKQYKFNNSSHISETESWIDTFQNLSRGGTFLFKAIEEAIKHLQTGSIEIDTIFILTDGEPNDVREQNAYLTFLKQNLPQHIDINTISIGHPSALLKAIASENRGIYDEYL